MIARTAQSAPLMELFSWRSRSHFQLASRELPVCREVFFAGSASHLLGERRRGGLLVPTNLLEVVPYILFIKRVLGFPCFIFVLRPEAGGLRRELFIS